jgi:hypothetical protein
MRKFSLVVSLLAFAALKGQAHAATVFLTFDDRPVGPSLVEDATPSPQTIIYPDATFSGGVILGNAASFPAQSLATSPNIYGTASFGSSLQNQLTIDLSVGFTQVSFALFNGVRFPESYVARAYDASGTLLTSQTLLNLPALFDSGYGVFNLTTANITRVTVSTLHATDVFDYFIDSVALSRSVQTVPVPGPAAGASLPALVALGAFAWTRRGKAVTA